MVFAYVLVRDPHAERPGARGPGSVVALTRRPRSSRRYGLATVGVMAGSVALMSGVSTGPEADRAVLSVLVLAPYLGLHLRHIRYAARGERCPAGGWTLAAMALLVAVMLPVVGVPWLWALYPLGASILLVLRPPWSLAFFAALAAAAAPLALALGVADLAILLTVGVLQYPVLLCLPVWLIAAARERAAARTVLADQAVARERLAVDAESRRTLGTALEAIAAAGDRVGSLTASSPTEADGELRGVVRAARDALDEARQMVTRFRYSPLSDEVDAALALLRTAGIDCRLDVSPGAVLPRAAPRSLLTTLRAEVARLLQDGSARSCVIAISGAGEDVRMEVRSEGAGAPARRVTAG